MKWERFILVIGLAVVAGLGLRLDLHWRVDVRRVLIESALIVGLLVVVVSRGEVRDLFGKIGGGYRAVAVAMVVLLVLGQLAGKGKVMFPFVEWEMYGDIPRNFFDDYHKGVMNRTGCEVVAKDGRVIAMDWLSLGQFAAKTRMEKGVGRVIGRYRNAKDVGGQKQAEKDLRVLLSALSRIYGRQHPGEELKAVRVFGYKDPIVPLAERGPVEVEWSLTVPVGDGGVR